MQFNFNTIIYISTVAQIHVYNTSVRANKSYNIFYIALVQEI